MDEVLWHGEGVLKGCREGAEGGILQCRVVQERFNND